MQCVGSREGVCCLCLRDVKFCDCQLSFLHLLFFFHSYQTPAGSHLVLSSHLWVVLASAVTCLRCVFWSEFSFSVTHSTLTTDSQFLWWNSSFCVVDPAACGLKSCRLWASETTSESKPCITTLTSIRWDRITTHFSLLLSSFVYLFPQVPTFSFFLDFSPPASSPSLLLRTRLCAELMS